MRKLVVGKIVINDSLDSDNEVECLTQEGGMYLTEEDATDIVVHLTKLFDLH